jgi:transposase
MIAVPAGVRVLVATKPVDFRRGADSLAALAHEELQRDPLSGATIVFRSKRADRLEIWPGTGPDLCSTGSGSSKARFAGRRSATA